MRSCILLLSFGLMATALAVPHTHKGKAGHHPEKDEDGSFHGRAPHGEDDAAFDHEAIIGSHKDAEEYDELTPEESKRRLAILVQRMDVNSDKHVSRTELKDWIINSFKSLSLEESEERFAEDDRDGDGHVTWNEYLSEEYDMGSVDEVPQELSKMMKDPEREDEIDMMEEEKIIFLAADEDKDGRLDKKEFYAFSHPEETERMFPTVVQHILMERDSNGNGQISFEEFTAARAKGKSSDWLEQERSRFSNELDKDGDGQLDRAEIQEWLVPANDNIADEEVTHLFGEADENKDDLLADTEILKHHETFVGSEATDYGEQIDNIHKYEL